MKELAKQAFLKFVLPVLAAVVVGIGSAVYTAMIATHGLDMRVSSLEKIMADEKLTQRTANLESQIERHEKALDRDFARHEATVADIFHKTEDQEKRITRLEALINQTQELLSEIRSDVKILLRGGQQ